ncbi:MAG: tripartite ATP-independent transporter DctM subunit [Paracoccaceae bacterium]|jgi:tripartite ATP-independent transporter DctM subunit
MSMLDLAAWSFPVFLLMIALRAPIGLAMLICGLGGTYLATGSPNIVLARLKGETYTTFANYDLIVVPFFLLMGQFASHSGMSASLFRAAAAFLGHRKGGVAMAAVGACGGFGAICGSSLATAATMGRVALPELRRYGYDGGFASAALAAGGTLGILIPPSVILVIYATLTQQNIAELFVAAVVPGIIAALGYMLVIAIYVRVVPNSAGQRAPLPWPDRMRALGDVWPVLMVFVLVVGGIYRGWFTPTDGAAIGALATGLIAALTGRLGWSGLRACLIATGKQTAMIFFIILGAAFYRGFLALAQVPQELTDVVTQYAFAPMTVLLIVLVFYLVMGCLMDSLSMILLTIPIFWPVISGLDFGLSPDHLAIWFGILVLIVVEVGLITPPVGLNLFVIHKIDGQTPMGRTFKAVLPFVASDIVRVALLLAFPAITLFAIN